MLAGTSSKAEVNEAQATLLEHAAEDLRAQRIGDAPADSDVLVTRSFLRLTPERAAELRSALIALVDEYSDAAPTGTPYEMTIALFQNEETP